jgi:hypothetical protein
LKNIFRVAAIRHSPADEVSQPSLFSRDSFRDPSILFVCHFACAQRWRHLLL